MSIFHCITFDTIEKFLYFVVVLIVAVVALAIVVLTASQSYVAKITHLSYP